MIVVDLTVLAPFLLRTSTFPLAVRVSRKDSLWVLPREWRLDMLNVLAAHAQTGRANTWDAYQLVLAGAMLIRESHESIDELTMFSLAVDADLSVSEAIYVLTGRRLGTKLVTNKKNILENCGDVAVSLETFGAD